MSKKKINLKTIAEHFNVSITAVSLALKGDRSISEELREKVISYAETHGYKQPSGKKNNHSYIALLVPIELDTIRSWGLFTDIIMHIEQYLSEEDYQLIMISVMDTMSEERIMKTFSALPIAGVISLHYTNNALFKKLHGQDIPVVIINNSVIDNNTEEGLERYCYSILIDDIQAGFDVANRVFEAHHTDVLYIDYERNDLPHIMIDRKLGVEKSMLLHNTEVTFYHERLGLVSKDDIMAVMDEYKEKITAIIAHDNYVGRMVYDLLEKEHLTQSISFISMGGILSPVPIDFSRYQIDGKKIATLACDIILTQIKKDTSKDDVSDKHIFIIHQEYIDKGTLMKKKIHEAKRVSQRDG